MCLLLVARYFAHWDLSAEFDRQCHALGAWGGVRIGVLAAQPEAATAIGCSTALPSVVMGDTWNMAHITTEGDLAWCEFGF